MMLGGGTLRCQAVNEMHDVEDLGAIRLLHLQNWRVSTKVRPVQQASLP